MLERKLLEAEEGDPVHTLAQARTSTLILRLDAEHNESVTRFLFNSRLAVGSSSEATARLLREITLSHATLSDAYLPDADLWNADLIGADLSRANLTVADLSHANLRLANLSEANLDRAVLSGAVLKGAVFEGATMPNGQKYEDWLESKNREEDGETEQAPI